MNYKYSIVIPAYNAEKYIAVMVESIINQTYFNWELIIIDDGSEDQTGKICEKYANEKIFVHHIRNKGQIGARIEGINRCTGDYTLVVDADDYLDPNCLLEVNKVLDKKQYDCVFFAFDCCDANLNYEWTTMSPSHTGEQNQREVIKWIVDTMNHGLVNKVVRTDAIKKGASEAITKKVKINGDYALIIPIMCYVNTAYYVDESLYKYRVFEESISHSRKYQHVIDTDYVTGSIVDVLKQHGLFDGQIEESVMRSYFIMIPWLLREVCEHHSITREELRKLQSGQFFDDSIIYEKEYLKGKLLKFEWRMLRSDANKQLGWMNIIFRALNYYYKTRQKLGKIVVEAKKGRK